MQKELEKKSLEKGKSISLVEELSRYVNPTNDESITIRGKSYTRAEWLWCKEKQHVYCGTNHFLVYDRYSGSQDVEVLRCHRRDCPYCAIRDMEKHLAKYRSKINDFGDPVFLTLTIANSHDPSKSISTLYNGMKKLKEKRIGKNNLRKFGLLMEEESERYSKELRKHKNYTEERIRRTVEKQWKALYEFKSRCGEILNDRRIHNPRFYHLLKGVGILEITYSVNKGFHSHFHCILDGLKIPQILISRIWKEITGSYVTDIRSGYDDYARILIKYTSSVWEFDKVPRELLDELLWALRGRKKIMIFNLSGEQSSIHFRNFCGRENCNETTRTLVKSREKLTNEKYMRMKKEGEELITYTQSQQYKDKRVIYWDIDKGRLQWRRE